MVMQKLGLRRYRENMLAQFSVVTFVIMVIHDSLVTRPV